MYAIVEIAGQQFKVEQGMKIFVHRQAVPEQEIVEFDQVLLVCDGENVTVGAPTVKDVIVEGKILDNTVRGEKVIVFKKKRKKGYRIRNGHRQDFTQVEILGIGAKKAQKTTPVKEEKTVEAVVEPVAEPEVKKAAPKKAAAKKTEGESEAKKPAAKKPAAKKNSEEKPENE